jgi:hypothetical protein
MWDEIWPVLIIGAVSIPLGLWVFSRGELYAKRHGKLKRSGMTVAVTGATSRDRGPYSSASSGRLRSRHTGEGRSQSTPRSAPAAPIQSVCRSPSVLPSSPPANAPSTRTP